MTLTEALESIGLTHRPGGKHGRRIVLHAETGEILGDYDAREGWDLFHRQRSAMS